MAGDNGGGDKAVTNIDPLGEPGGADGVPGVGPAKKAPPTKSGAKVSAKKTPAKKVPAADGSAIKNRSTTSEGTKTRTRKATKSVTDSIEANPPETKPSSGLPDLVVDAESATPTAHLVPNEMGGTDHIAPPRVFPRHLPPVTAWEFALRGNAIATIAAKHFAPLVVRQLRQIRRGALPIDAYSHPLRRTFEDLGGTFMKFGQLVASSPGVFSEAVSNEFRACLDTGPEVEFHHIRSRIEADLGMSVEEAYAEIDPDPVGRASIAVVHRAKLHDGRVVGVKILRPQIHRIVSTDLDMLQPLLELIAGQTGDETAGWLLQMLDGFREQIGEELDLRNEARAMMHFRTLIKEADLPAIVVPEVVPELSSRNVLTMEFLEGEPIDDLAAAARFGVDPAPLVAQVVRGFFLMTVRWGVFHGDVHAGNLLLLPDGRIGVLDWGIVGRLDADTHRFFVRIIQGALGNEDAWDDVAAHLVKTYGPAIRDGLGLDDEHLSDFVRDLVSPVLTRPFGEVSLSSILTAPQAQMARARAASSGRVDPEHRPKAQRPTPATADDRGVRRHGL